MSDNWLKRKNAENWIHINKQLAKMMLESVPRADLYNYGRDKLNFSMTQITSRLKAAYGYGIVEITGRKPFYYCELTKLGRKLYEEISKQDKG